MPEYNEVLAAARAAVDAADEARRSAASATDRLTRTTAERDALQRALGPHDRRVIAAERAVAEARSAVEGARARANRAGRIEQTAVRQFGRLADPREQIGRLPDNMPLLLMPMRIETRFVGDELLVRVYPDVWAADAFEPRLSEVEVASGARYWSAVWASGGTRDGRLAAWRGLVRSHGSGRAAWIVRELQPDNAPEAPEKADPADVILVVASDDPLPANDRPAAATYWAAVWRAEGDATGTAAAEHALEADLGQTGAEAVRAQPPGNLAENPPPPHRRSDVGVTVAFLELPSVADVDARRASWTQAPRAHLLPERLVLLGYSGDTQVLEEIGAPVPATLVVGPDPSASPDEQLRIEDGELKVPDDLRWLVDFDEAVAQGMGFRVALTAATRGGFGRLLVVGLRLKADATTNGTDLSTLLTHHLHSRAGFGLVPQGTPTNNTEAMAAGHDRNDDPDRSFIDWFERPDFRVADGDWRAKRDGQWLAELIGIEPEVLLHAPYADATDQREGRAANVALWQATWGYFLETVMAPVLDGETIDATREFFVGYVSGRGAVPALRIGRQPYGVLPTTAFSRLRWEPDIDLTGRTVAPGPAYLARLDALLRVMGGDWNAMAGGVRHVRSEGDAHRTLLDVLGLHAASVEFHQRYAESVEDLFNRLNLDGSGGVFVAALIALGMEQRGMELLARLGYDGADRAPDILRRLFLGRQHELRGPLVDDRPLSETDPVRAYTDDGHNYLTWLRDAASTSLETLRREDGFTDERPPTALLYLLLRHALLLGWWDTSIRLRVDAEVYGEPDVLLARHEAPFVHVAGEPQAMESRWAHLYSTEVRVTDREDQLVADYIPQVLGEHRATRHLAEQIQAIDLLREVPTARLERVLAEHLDCATYRLDAWRLGLVNVRLKQMRYPGVGGEGEEVVRGGVHIGCYGWLEEVRREPRRLTPVTDLDDELAAEFAPPSSAPLMRDSTNGGYVHGPSLNHATTAAVLRAGYLTGATPANPHTMAVNLSSRRVRLALSLLEGVRNGLALGALLGYQFERGLHDRHSLAEVDRFIYPLRKAFPLRADRLSDTATGTEVPIDAIEARNVLDGLELARHTGLPGRQNYPFGLPGLPAAGPAESAAIDAEVDRLRDASDAIADLALAEGVHQAVLGNMDRVAATLDAYSKVGFPPEPEVVATPRSGTTLLHRVGLHMRAGADPTVSPVADVAMTPRAKAEPAVNEWLAGLLPLPDDVVCRVRWTEPDTGTPRSLLVTQEDLQLQPIDLLYVLRVDDEAAMSDLDDRIAQRVLDVAAPRPDTVLEIHYTERVSGSVTFFQLAALVDRLRAVVLTSRPLRPTDVALHSEASSGEDTAISANRARVALVVTSSEAVRTLLTTYDGDLRPLLADPVANRAALVAGIDTFVDRLVSASSAAGRHGVAQAGWGSLLDWRRSTYAFVLAGVADVAARWTSNLARADELIQAHDTLPETATDEERFALLQQAERLLTTAPTSPRPATPAALRTLVGTARTANADKLGELASVATTSAATLHDLLDEVRALLPLTTFDPEGLDLTPFEDRVVAFAGDLLARAAALLVEVETRIAAGNAGLTAHDATADQQARFDTLTGAAKALLGDDMVLVPEFTVGAARAAEWQQAMSASTSGELLSGLGDRDFPVDDWLSGVARVRPSMRDWERVVLLTGVVGRADPALVPVQLPYRADDRWLALEYPDDYVIDGDRLLYTAHYRDPLVATGPQCGLLLDEWTEVIPAANETTGLAFNYDRPNSEPPQAMLLVVPPVTRGAWQWEDVVTALHETLDLAKTRGVEPIHTDVTPYAQFLPATVTAATARAVSITTNFAVNNAAVFREST